jgi:hypothetical protein
MNTKWGVGDPHQYLTNDYFAAYDDHRYIKYDPSIKSSSSPNDYINLSCGDDRGGNVPTIVGEWSISVNTGVEYSSNFWPIANHLDFYSRWFGAQKQAYEKQDGWIFWSWKTQFTRDGKVDPRWSYVGKSTLAKPTR